MESAVVITATPEPYLTFFAPSCGNGIIGLVVVKVGHSAAVNGVLGLLVLLLELAGRFASPSFLVVVVVATDNGPFISSLIFSMAVAVKFSGSSDPLLLEQVVLSVSDAAAGAVAAWTWFPFSAECKDEWVDAVLQVEGSFTDSSGGGDGVISMVMEGSVSGIVG
jgi:hypothetical protein